MNMTRLLSHLHFFVHLIWLRRTRMDEGWVEMEVQSWHLHCRILCQMVIDQTFEGGAWLDGRKRPNLGGLQLLQGVLDIKTMPK